MCLLEIMQTNPPVDWPVLEQILDRAPLQVPPDTSILDAITLMSQGRESSCVLVVDGVRLVGIFTERDVVKLTASGVNLSGMEIARVMAQPVISLTLDEDRDTAIALSVMRQHRIRHLPVVDELGQLVGLVTQDQIYEAIAPLARLEDSSDREQLELALQASEAKLSQILDSAIAAIASFRVWDNRDWEYEYWSAGCEVLFGYTVRELMADKTLWLSQVFPDDRETIVMPLFEAFFAERNTTAEYRFYHKDGSVRWISSTYSSQRIEDNCWTIVAVNQDISEAKRNEVVRKQTEAALRLSEEQRRLALDLTHTASWDWNLIAGEVVWSDKMFHLLGLTPGAVSPTYTIWRNCVYPEDLERLEAAIALHLQNQTLYSEEYRVVYSDGSIHWLLSKGQGVYDAAGQAVRMVGITLDISDRKQLEIALQQSEEQLRLALDLNAIGSWDWHTTTEAMTWNDYNYRLLGYQPREVEPSYQLWHDRIHPDDVAEVDRKLARALETQTDCEVEFRVVMPDGSIRWHLGKGRGIYNEARQLVRMIGVTFDISDRKQAERKIREQATLLDIASDAIFVRDLDHHILYWNRGAEQLYGWQAAEVMGQKANELLQEDASQVSEIMQTLFDRGEWHGEIRKATKTGKEVIVEGRWTLVRDEAGQPKSILTVNADITEKKQLEAQFYRAQRLESIGTLASGIAHDFNNLLTPILAVAQLLPLKLPNLDDQTRRLLSLLEDSAKRGANLVQQVLSFSRGTEGKRVILQVGHLLSEVVNLAQRTFPKSIEISTAIPTRDLWTISADTTQIHQVFMNLLVNARDAMPEGGSLAIAAKNRHLDENYARMNLEARVASYVVITVSDTGTGIPPELIERIFHHQRCRQRNGTGTGNNTGNCEKPQRFYPSL
jgi:PAS domain S-box-containing protein